jgi:hypothetical protein
MLRVTVTDDVMRECMVTLLVTGNRAMSVGRSAVSDAQNMPSSANQAASV